MTAVDRLAEVARKRKTTLTVTFDPDSFEPWAVTSPMLTARCYGGSVEAACEMALATLKGP